MLWVVVSVFLRLNFKSFKWLSQLPMTQFDEKCQVIISLALDVNETPNYSTFSTFFFLKSFKFAFLLKREQNTHTHTHIFIYHTKKIGQILINVILIHKW